MHPLNNSLYYGEKLKVSVQLNELICDPKKIIFLANNNPVKFRLIEVQHNNFVYEILLNIKDSLNIKAIHPFCLKDELTIHLHKENLISATNLLLINFLKTTSPEDISYNWTSAILLLGLNKLNESSDSPDLNLFLNQTYKLLNNQKKIITSADLASIALPALKFKSTEKNFDIDQIKERTLLFFKAEPRNPLNSLNHVGHQHRFLPFLPLTKNFIEDSIWSDSIVMYALTSLQLSRSLNDEELFKFSLEQPLIFAKYLQQPNGLYKHAYYYKSNEVTPESSYWARGNGWQAFALIEYLSDPNISQVYKSQYQGLFNKLIDGYLAQLGFIKLSSTLLNSTSNSNYYETSSTCLFAYAIAKAVRLNILPESYLDFIKETSQDLKGFVVLENETFRLKGISWPTDSFKYDWYYTNIPTGTNISYGLGTYFLLASELQQLCLEKNYCY